MRIFKKTWKRVTAFCIALILAMTVTDVSVLQVLAAEVQEEVSYIEYMWNEETSELTSEVKTVSSYSEITGELDIWYDGWYVLSENVEFENRIQVEGTTFLILKDGATLTANAGIQVEDSLYIYAQSEDENVGKLIASASNTAKSAGIGGNDGLSNGEIVIHGGDITASGGNDAAGIGGGNQGNGGNITIYGGKIDAVGGNSSDVDYSNTGGAGIGGGNNGAGGNIAIYGGDITVKGGCNGAGIGGGNNGAGGVITINDGSVKASGGYTLVLWSSGGAGIGGGASGAGGDITINGGTVTTEAINESACGGAGIGGGYFGIGGNITINGGEIIANTGNEGAGIGGGSGKTGGSIIINEGEITANGGNSGAGIGGGVNGSGGEITINGGVITANGGVTGAGIGGGRYGSGGKTFIYNGNVSAVGGDGAAGIGGGNGAAGDEVVIYGGNTTAIGGGNSGAGIGGGYYWAGGKVTIEGGTVIASGKYGAGIGGGENGSGGTVVITGGNVKATAEGGLAPIGKGLSGSAEGTLKDGNGNDIVLSTLTLCGVTQQKEISAVTGTIDYGVNDVKTLDDDKLYFYLPKTENIHSVVMDSKEYFGVLEELQWDVGMEGTYHHSTYTAGDNNTILAGCSTEGCDQSATVGIANPELTVFTGDAIEAKITVTPENALTPTVNYKALKGSLTDGKPVNCGEYKASISLGDVTINTTYEITKKTPEATDFNYADPNLRRYDGTPKIPIITANKEGMGEISVSYYISYSGNPTGTPVDVGNYGVKVSVAEGENYTAITDLKDDNWKYGIEKAYLNSSYFVFTAPKAEELVYDDKAKAAVVTPAEGISGLGDITVSYYSVTDGVESAVEVEPIDVGTYQTKISVAAGNNNNATTELLTEDGWRFQITPAESVIESVSGKRNHATNTTIYDTTDVSEIILSGAAVSGEQELTGTFKLADSVTELSVGENSYPCIFLPDNPNYKQAEGEVILTVVHNEVESITVTKTPDKLFYIYGEKFEIAGTVVEAAYEDGSTADVTEDIVFEDSILEKSQTEIELSYTFGEKSVTAKVTGIQVEYLVVPSEFLFNNDVKKEWYGKEDGNVEVSAEGYTISDTLNGTYEEIYPLIYTKDGICRKTLYLKNALGQMTDGVEVEVQYDHSAPEFGTDGGIIIGENKWNQLLNTISFTSAYKEVPVEIQVEAEDHGGSNLAEYYYYVDTTGSKEVLTTEELSEKIFTVASNKIIDSISEENTYVYYVYVTDNAGNRSDIICSDGVIIDKTQPIITDSLIPEEMLLDTSAVVTLRAEDSESGIKEYYLVYDDSDLSASVNKETISSYEGVITNNTGSFSLNNLVSNTTYYCILGVKDNAGNVTCTTINFLTKKTLPVFEETEIPKITGTYGQSLAEMTLSVSTAISKNNIAGSWSITNENKESIYPAVGMENTYEITFTPENTERYSSYVTTVIPEISKKQLTVKEVIAQDRDYIPNSNTVDVEITLQGVRQGDDVTLVNADNIQGTLNGSNAGIYTAVNLPVLSLEGKQAENYTLLQPEGAVATQVTIHKLAAEIMLNKESYEKTFGEAAFMLETTDTNGEKDVQYAVTVGNDVVSVSDGKVTILKAGTAEITVSLPESTNYQAAESKIITINVAKKSDFTAEETNRSYLYLRENTDTINLATLLPSDCGMAEYAEVITEGAVSYKTEPKIHNGVLSYILSEGKVDEYGTISITVKSDNYTDITINIKVRLSDKMPVSLKEGMEVTLQNNTIVYGESLADAKFSPAIFVDSDGNEVAGTLNWKTPNETPNAGDVNAEWIFSPSDAQAYMTMEGSITLTISKKQLTVKEVIAKDRDYIPNSNVVDIEEIILNGVEEGDEVVPANVERLQGTLSSSNAGTYNAITVPMLTLTGEQADNYILLQPETAVKTNVIIRKLAAEIMLNKESYEKTFGDTAFLVEVTDTNEEDDVQYFVVSGNDVVSVENGEVTILKAGTAKIRVSLMESTNYQAAENKTITINIAKESGFNVEEISRNYLYLRENADTINLAALLPTDCGMAEYAKVTTEGEVTYKIEPKIQNGILSYTLNEGKADEQGTIYVTVKTDNYTDIVIEINIRLVDKKTVNLKEGMEVTLQKNTLVYGETLADVKFNPTVFVDEDGNEVAGTLNWKTPNEILNAGEVNAEWIFIPSDSQAYKTNKGSITLTVEKAKAVITIASGKEHYDKKFVEEDFELKGISVTGDGKLVYTVTEGKTLCGEEKAEDNILTVSENGVVSLHGTGVVTIFVESMETENYKAAEVQKITVEVTYTDEFFVEEIEEVTYTGKAVKPKVRVLDGMTESFLQEGIDYTVTYKNNIQSYLYVKGSENVGETKAPYVLVKGKGNYSSTMKVYFTIQPKDISDMEDESIIVKEILLEENGKVQTKVPSLSYNKKKLSGIMKPQPGSEVAKTKDFVYSYPQLNEEATKETAFNKAGTWKILVEGTGNYIGSRYVDVIIAPKGGKMSNAKITKLPSKEYTGKSIEFNKDELVVTAKVDGETTTLEKGIHYNVEYKNNIEIGIATVLVKGIPENGFAGTKIATFKITGTSINKAKVEGIVSKVYNGKEQKQDITITVTQKVKTESGVKKETVTLTQKDYEIIYDKNTNVGTAKMIIRGIGSYTGTIQKTFKITPYDVTGETNAKGELKKNSSFIENNGLLGMADGQLSMKYVKGGAKPEVELHFDGTKLKEGIDYTVSYKNNKNVYTLKDGMEGYEVSKAPTVVIKGKGNFKGNIQKIFMITSRSMQDSEIPVIMTVDDKAVSSKKGGYLSKPVLTDADGNVLKQGKDYTAPVYTIVGENGETVTLGKKDKVETVGSVITVRVEGMGAYAGGEPLTATYVITKENFAAMKAAKLKKDYTGREVMLTESDFYNADGTSKITIGKDKKKLRYGVDFEIVQNSYKNNLKKGTASVTLRGISEEGGLYGGTKTINFTIGTRGLKDWFAWLGW